MQNLIRRNDIFFYAGNTWISSYSKIFENLVNILQYVTDKKNLASYCYNNFWVLENYLKELPSRAVNHWNNYNTVLMN